MATSTIPAVKAALLAALQARPALNGVQVEWTHPGKNIERDAMYFGNTSLNEASAAIGQRRREENYTVAVVVDVGHEGDDAPAVEARVWELVGEIEDTLRPDPTLGGVPGLLVAQFAGGEQHNYLTSDGRGSQCVVRVACRTRI